MGNIQYLKDVLEHKSTQDLEKDLDGVLGNLDRMLKLKEIDKNRDYNDFIPAYISLANSISDEIFFRTQSKFYGK